MQFYTHCASFIKQVEWFQDEFYRLNLICTVCAMVSMYQRLRMPAGHSARQGVLLLRYLDPDLLVLKVTTCSVSCNIFMPQLKQNE